MKKSILICLVFVLFACKKKTETCTPEIASVSESIYATGLVKSKNQYLAYATVNGIIEQIYVEEGDTVRKGNPILLISNETQKLTQENAGLTADFADYNRNQDKLNDARMQVDVLKNKMILDSVLYHRQKKLWQQEVGTQLELEQKELAFQNSKAAYYSSIVKYTELNRQLKYSSDQAKKNLKISTRQAGDFILKSEVDGVVYDILKSPGEIVGLQTPLAMLGDASHFILEMQVDEYDIFKIEKGQTVLITMDSYKGQVFEALVSRIIPAMNERSKTFTVEAEFVNAPKHLYPNVSFEANIILRTKENVVLIPRSFLLNDSTVLNTEGKEVYVKTGLKDYQKVEIISGLGVKDEIQKPLR